LPLVVRLALRDLRGGLRGVRILAACLALGVFAIAAAGSTQQAVREGLRNDGQVLLGGDLELRLTYRTLEADQRAALEDHGTVTHGQELRAMARRGSGADLRQSLVELKTVDEAYPLFGNIALSDGQGQATSLAQSLSLGADGVWGVAVERSLLSRCASPR
jgi:putative ABC transport system permease protein